MELMFYFRLLLRKKMTIILLTFSAALITFILILNKKDLYESVGQYSTGFTSEKVKLSDGSVAVDIYTLDIKFNNVIETFNSPRVIGMLSYKLMLHDLDPNQKPFRTLTEKRKSSKNYRPISKDTIRKVLQEKIASSQLLSPTNKTEKDIQDYLKVFGYDYTGLKEMLIIRRVAHTDYLDIIFQSENPDLSAYVVNNLGVEFLNYYKDLNDVRNTESAQNIKQVLQLQQQMVDSLTNELKAARISQGALDPVEQTKNAMETVKELQLELSSSQNLFNLESRLSESYADRMNYLNGQLNGNGTQDALSLFKKRDELREQLASSSNPDPGLIREINSVESQIKQQSTTGVSRSMIHDEIYELTRKISESKARKTAAQTSIEQLKRLIAVSTSKSNVSPKTQVEIEAIERQLEIENNELKNIREKVSVAEGLIKDDPTANFRQTLIGEPDNEPVPKHKILTTGLAGICTFITTCLFFLITGIFDNTIKTPSFFAKLTELQAKSIINEISFKKLSLEALMLSDAPAGQTKNELLFKNSIRKLRQLIEETGQQVFLFTSTQQGSGKSTLLQALAYSLLLNNRKVLIIDANFENNQISRAFDIKTPIEDIISDKEIEYIHTEAPFSFNENAGSEYLLEQVLMENKFIVDKINQRITGTDKENLFVLGCKGGNHTPAEQAWFQYFPEFLKQAKRNFDFIFIESAGMNLRSDTYELLQFTDNVITVFSAKEALTQTDYKSIESIGKTGNKNFGVILNRVDPEYLNL